MDLQVLMIRVELHRRHLMLLDVCCERYPDTSFCGRRMLRHCLDRGIPFHQKWLSKLVTVGLLQKEESTRGGKRRYYRIKDLALARRVADSIKQSA